MIDDYLNPVNISSNQMIIDGLHDYLAQKNIFDLRQIAMKIGEFISKKTGKIGGIHDYLLKLSEHDLISFIMKKAEEYPELKEMIKEAPKDECKETEEFISSLNREKLIAMAFGIEKYEKKMMGMEASIGGLHDYIFGLSDEEIRKLIDEKLMKYPELNKLSDLKEMIDSEIN